MIQTKKKGNTEQQAPVCSHSITLDVHSLWFDSEVLPDAARDRDHRMVGFGS